VAAGAGAVEDAVVAEGIDMSHNDDIGYHPGSLLLQWHITERCNLRCAHCYQEGYSGMELGFNELLGVFGQFKDLLNSWNSNSKRPVRGHITVTGGEPFLREDFLDLLDLFSTHRDQLSFAVLTNGTHIDAKMARYLKGVGIGFVQVSIDGSRETHDRIRGEGSFDRTVAAIGHLVKAKVRTLISFTAQTGNFREFPDVARLGRRLGVSRVWADRFIPEGKGGSNQETEVLTPLETKEFFKIMERAESKYGRGWFSRTEIAMGRALQFLVAGGRPYSCKAGDSLITVMPNGDLYPCRRMPIRVGNLLETPLSELYNCETFRELRNKDKISEVCRDCVYAGACRGGLRCLSYAVTGDPFRTDPGCWIAGQLSSAPSATPHSRSQSLPALPQT